MRRSGPRPAVSPRPCPSPGAASCAHVQAPGSIVLNSSLLSTTQRVGPLLVLVVTLVFAAVVTTMLPKPASMAALTPTLVTPLAQVYVQVTGVLALTASGSAPSAQAGVVQEPVPVICRLMLVRVPFCGGREGEREGAGARPQVNGRC
jgi:hypothetical protein